MTARGWRAPMLVAATASMAYGVWLGLLRVGWALPLPWSDQLILHGPLMIGGFLGTLIGLERAVGLARPWAYLAPVCTAAGAIVLVFGPASTSAGALLITLGSCFAVLVFLVVLRQQFSLFALTMLGGAACWVVGNAGWSAGASIYRIVFWWIAFVILTIGGERLELNRLRRPSSGVRATFVGSVIILTVGVVTLECGRSGGATLTGIGLLALALWLSVHDVARRTVRQRGVTRFMAICLLTGYAWLAVAGGLLLVTTVIVPGTVYDAVLHTIFVGFVLSMIFGHAPIVFPAVLGVVLEYRPFAYVPLVVLHLSVAMRVIGDLVDAFGRLRVWGALGNALAIVLFMTATVMSVSMGHRPAVHLRT